MQRRIAGKNALRDRIEETALQFVLRAGRFERERGEDGELERRIGGSLVVKRIGDVGCLAEPERQGKHDGLADFFDDGVGEPRRIVDCRGRRPRMNHFRLSQPGSGWKRGPYFSASRLSVSRTSAVPRARA